MRIQLSDDEVGMLLTALPYLLGEDDEWEILDAGERSAAESIVRKLDGSPAHGRWARAQIAAGFGGPNWIREPA